MKKINLNVLKEKINNSETLMDILACNEYDDEYDQHYLTLQCLSSVSDDYETFAEIYEDGLLTMNYGGVNILDTMSSIEEYYDPTTGEILPEFDTYETVIDVIISSVEQDIRDERDFLNDVCNALGLDMED